MNSTRIYMWYLFVSKITGVFKFIVKNIKTDSMSKTLLTYYVVNHSKRNK